MRRYLLAALLLSTSVLAAISSTHAQETPTTEVKGIDVRVGDPTYPLTLDPNESFGCYVKRSAASDTGQFVALDCWLITDLGVQWLTTCDSNAVGCSALPFIRRPDVVQGDSLVLRKYTGGVTRGS